LRMPDPDPEHEAAAVVGVDLRVRGGDVRRVVLPDVQDAAGDRERRRGLQVGPALVDARAAPDPQRAVAEGLYLSGCVGAAAAAAAPDADGSEFHWGIVAGPGSVASARERSARNQPATPDAISSGISGRL